VGDDELVVGAEVDDEDGDEVPESPVVVVLEPDVSDDALPLLVVEAAGLVAAALVPGWSWETTMPMATVAPVAATITPRVTTRSRALALSLSAGVLGWAGADMGAGSLVGGTHSSHHAHFDTHAARAVVLL
jgi:hypothetical protein